MGERVEEVERAALYLDAGLKQITNVTYDEQGRPVFAIAESALYATILDENTGGVKTAKIAASVVWDEKGNLRSMAQIVADAIYLEGKVNVLDNMSVYGQVGIQIPNGNLMLPKGGVNAVNGFFTDVYIRNAEIRFGNDTSYSAYVGEDITSYNPTDKSYTVRKALGHK